MRALADFFGCCTKDKDRENQEHEVTVHLTERRTHSEGKRTARIQRSLPKQKQLDLSTKYSQNPTLTNTARSHSNKVAYQHVRQEHSPSHSAASYDRNSTLFPYKLTNNNHHPVQNSERPLLHNFTNFEPQEYHHYQSQPWTDVDSLVINAEPPSVKTPAPRLLLERRARKVKEESASMTSLNLIEKEPRKEVLNRRSPFMASVLETIDERLSLPSCSESQIQDINRNPSRSVFFRENEESERAVGASPMAQKFNSCIMDREGIHLSGRKMARSQNIQKFEEKLSVEHEQLIKNKIRVDIQIFQNELKTLLEEEKHLLDQSFFSKQQLQQTLERKANSQRQLQAKLARMELIRKGRLKIVSGNGPEGAGFSTGKASSH